MSAAMGAAMDGENATFPQDSRLNFVLWMVKLTCLFQGCPWAEGSTVKLTCPCLCQARAEVRVIAPSLCPRSPGSKLAKSPTCQRENPIPLPSRSRQESGWSRKTLRCPTMCEVQNDLAPLQLPLTAERSSTCSIR